MVVAPQRYFGPELRLRPAAAPGAGLPCKFRKFRKVRKVRKVRRFLASRLPLESEKSHFFK